MPDDIELLDKYARTNSEPAFAELVSRHVNLVYSVALRSTGNAHAAQEISQAVFVILARKAKSLSSHTALSGWLYQAAIDGAKLFADGSAPAKPRTGGLHAIDFDRNSSRSVVTNRAIARRCHGPSW